MHTSQTFVQGLNTQVNTRTSFYSQGGWAGKNHNFSLGVSDIAKLVRDYVKTKYPKYKFSVTKESSSSLRIALMSGPVSPFCPIDITRATQMDLRWGEIDFLNRWNRIIEKQVMGVNHYYIRDSFFLTETAKDMFEDIKNFTQSYNYDDSDAMTDYFDTNFYLTMEIGKWDRPFITTN